MIEVAGSSRQNSSLSHDISASQFSESSQSSYRDYLRHQREAVLKEIYMQEQVAQASNKKHEKARQISQRNQNFDAASQKSINSQNSRKDDSISSAYGIKTSKKDKAKPTGPSKGASDKISSKDQRVWKLDQVKTQNKQQVIHDESQSKDSFHTKLSQGQQRQSKGASNVDQAKSVGHQESNTQDVLWTEIYRSKQNINELDTQCQDTRTKILCLINENQKLRSLIETWNLSENSFIQTEEKMELDPFIVDNIYNHEFYYSTTLKYRLANRKQYLQQREAELAILERKEKNIKQTILELKQTTKSLQIEVSLQQGNLQGDESNEWENFTNDDLQQALKQKSQQVEFLKAQNEVKRFDNSAKYDEVKRIKNELKSKEQKLEKAKQDTQKAQKVNDDAGIYEENFQNENEGEQIRIPTGEEEEKTIAATQKILSDQTQEINQLAYKIQEVTRTNIIDMQQQTKERDDLKNRILLDQK